MRESQENSLSEATQSRQRNNTVAHLSQERIAESKNTSRLFSIVDLGAAVLFQQF